MCLREEVIVCPIRGGHASLVMGDSVPPVRGNGVSLERGDSVSRYGAISFVMISISWTMNSLDTVVRAWFV